MNAPNTLHQLLPALTFPDMIHDADPQETAEWREAFLALIATQGPERARQMLDELARLARGF